MGIVNLTPDSFLGDGLFKSTIGNKAEANLESIKIELERIYEDFRKKSITSEGVNGLICGFGSLSYILAIEAMNNLIKV